MKRLLLWIGLFCFPGLLTNATAQTEKDLLKELLEEERSSLEALVLYPEETRLAILQAAQHPEALIKLESMQRHISATFQDLVEPYSKETQEMLWDLTRYPELITRLVGEGQKSSAAISRVLEDYPDAVNQRAMVAGTGYYSVLEKIEALNQSSLMAFEEILSGYPLKTQTALRHLIEMPEVLTILTENIRLTILIGDIYQKDPQWVLRQADSLNLVVARQYAQDLEDWKEGLEKDPAALEELKSSAESFAREYGYDDEYYPYDDDLYYDAEAEPVIVEKHYYYHYPYWFGYPSWYVYPRWRLYPFWYEWGFYYRPGRRVVIIQMPSFFFTSWYFYHPRHHYYYPRLTTHFVDYYYGHRKSMSSIVATVDTWKQRNREVISDDWLVQEEGRVERIREFGRLEAAREDYNRQNPDRQASPTEYLDRNSGRYPALNRAVIRKELETGKTERPTYEPAPTPRTERPPVEKPKYEPAQRQPVPTRERTEARQEAEKRDQERYRDLEKARELHRQTWEREKEKARTVERPRTQSRTTKPPAEKEKSTQERRRNQ